MAKNLADYNKLNNKEKKEYEDSIKKMYVIMGVATVFFYIIPFLIVLTGELAKAFLPMMLFMVNPLFVYMSCFLHSRRFKFNILIPAALGIFFVPTALIFYRDYRFALFGFVYLVLGLFGEFTGHLFILRKKSKRQPFGLNRLVNGPRNKEKKKADNKKANKKK